MAANTRCLSPGTELLLLPTYLWLVWALHVNGYRAA